MRSGRKLRFAGSRGRFRNAYRSESVTRARYVSERLIAACCLRADVVVGKRFGVWASSPRCGECFIPQRTRAPSQSPELAWRRAHELSKQFAAAPLCAYSYRA